jgi:DNA-binding NarL/FixJ family response regulator
LRELRTLAERGCSAQIIAKKLRRTESSVRNKVLMHGLSLTMKTEQTRAAADETSLIEEIRASDHHNASSSANRTAE